MHVVLDNLAIINRASGGLLAVCSYRINSIYGLPFVVYIHGQTIIKG